MRTREQALQLAQSLVSTGQRMGVQTTALLTDMNQPLGRMCGNAVELLESIDVLKGGGPDDVRLLTIELCAELLIASRIDQEFASARQRCVKLLDTGAAYERYCRMVTAQGGDPKASLNVAPAFELTAGQDGVIASIDTEAIGLAIIKLGGGRRKMGDPIDHSVGPEMQVRPGDCVTVGTPLVRAGRLLPPLARRRPSGPRWIPFRPPLRPIFDLRSHDTREAHVLLAKP